jgi:hypothetical protein
VHLRALGFEDLEVRIAGLQANPSIAQHSGRGVFVVGVVGFLLQDS